MKDKKVRKRWILFFCVLLLLALVIIFAIYLPFKNKAKAPISNNASINYATTAKKALDNKDYSAAVDNYDKAIEANPANTENYIDKSAAEYAAGDKEAAKATVEEGLVVDPNNELLKARLDALEKGTFDSNIGAERQ